MVPDTFFMLAVDTVGRPRTMCGPYLSESEAFSLAMDHLEILLSVHKIKFRRDDLVTVQILECIFMDKNMEIIDVRGEEIRKGSSIHC